MSTLPPEIELAESLGSGSTGSVQRGRLRRPFGRWPAGAEVAVKTLHAAHAADAARKAAWRAEALIGARELHPGLVRVLWAGALERGPTLVMELVPGASLADLQVELAANGAPLGESEVRAIGARLAEALASLHAAGWVHGDVKPENVRRAADGAPVLVDLGFARTLEGPPADQEADPGTVFYLSPERARGARATPAADVYALGVALYELATGAHPFAGVLGPGARAERPALRAEAPARKPAGAPERKAAELDLDLYLGALSEARALAASERVPELSPFLDRALAAALDPDPSARPSAAELAVRLREGEAGAWWQAERSRAALGALAANEAPLVGRDAELAALAGAFGRVLREGRGRALWLEGPRGIGKSRLAGEFAQRARLGDEPPLFLHARCRPLDESSPGEPLVRLVERHLGFPRQFAGARGVQAAVGARVPPAEARALLEVFAARTGAGPASPAAQANLAGALGAWLGSLGRERPAIVFLDDLNFADPTTLEVLRRWASALAETRALLLLGRRLDEPVRHPAELERAEAELARRASLERVALAMLSQADVLELVERVFHPRAPRLRIAEVLWRHSRGLPGLVGEILRALVDRGDAHRAEGRDARLLLDIAPDELPLPRSLSQVIAERYRLLPATERAWLGRLAVVGGRIEPAFLARAFPSTLPGEEPRQAEDERAIDELLGRLVRWGWLVNSGSLRRFARPAQREAIYRSLGAARRARLHRAAARALDPGPAGRLSLEDAYQRAFHWRAAGEDRALMRVLRPLLAKLATRGEPQRVMTLAEWGLAALDRRAQEEPDKGALERDRVILLEAGADAAHRLGQRALERHWLDRLAALSIDPGEDPAHSARIYLLHARHAMATGLYGPARGMLKNAVEFSDLSGDSELASEARRRLAAVEADIGRRSSARVLARESLDLAAHDLQRAVSHLQIGLIDLMSDRLESSLREVDRALALWRASGEGMLPGIAAAAHMLRGRAYRLAGRPRRAQAALQHALRLARRAGERRLAVEIQARLGAIEFEVGRTGAAEEHLRDAQLAAREIEDRRGGALAALWLGLLLAQRDDAEALAQLERAVAEASELGLSRIEALGRAVRARTAFQAGDLARAEREIARARELVGLYGTELADRIVVEGTGILVDERLGREREALAARRSLARVVARAVRRTQNRPLRERHERAAQQLMEAVLSASGAPYPRFSPAP